MKLSIVTVVFNALGSIERTFDSIVSQSFRDFEYVVIDGGSTDGTLNFLELNKDHFSILISEKDHGIYDAMNKGCAICSGEWIVFMNAGDTFASKDTLNSIFSSELDFSSADVIYGDTYNCNGVNTFITKAEPLNKIKYRLPFCHQSSFIKRELLNEYRFDLKYRFVADYDLMKRLYDDGKIFVYIEKPLSCYFSEGGFSSRNIVNVFKEESQVSGIRDLRWIIRFFHVYISFLLHHTLSKDVEEFIRRLLSKKADRL